MYRARVVRTSGGIWVECAAIVPGSTFGPCQHIGTAPSVGDWVLVVDVGEPASPDLIIVGRLV